MSRGEGWGGSLRGWSGSSEGRGSGKEGLREGHAQRYDSPVHQASQNHCEYLHKYMYAKLFSHALAQRMQNFP